MCWKAIAIADLVYLIYITIYNGCVCAGLTDYPVEVSTNSMAYFLRWKMHHLKENLRLNASIFHLFSVMVAHQQLLSIPSDLLVCLMTFSRLKIILKVECKEAMASNQPRPIIHEVIAIYMLSFILDGPNWMMFTVEVNILKKLLPSL